MRTDRQNLVVVAVGARSKTAIQGAVLLEVLVALALFVAAAAIVTGGLNRSVESVERLRLNTHAANLTISVLSELQMGIKSMAVNGPQLFEAPFEKWSWEVVALPVEPDKAKFEKVEVVIRHTEAPLVHRLGQVIQRDENSAASDSNLINRPASAP